MISSPSEDAVDSTTIRAADPPASRTTSRSTVIRPILSSAPPMGMTTPALGTALVDTAPVDTAALDTAGRCPVADAVGRRCRAVCGLVMTVKLVERTAEPSHPGGPPARGYPRHHA